MTERKRLREREKERERRLESCVQIKASKSVVRLLVRMDPETKVKQRRSKERKPTENKFSGGKGRRTKVRICNGGEGSQKELQADLKQTHDETQPLVKVCRPDEESAPNKNAQQQVKKMTAEASQSFLVPSVWERTDAWPTSLALGIRFSSVYLSWYDGYFTPGGGTEKRPQCNIQTTKMPFLDLPLRIHGRQVAGRLHCWLRRREKRERDCCYIFSEKQRKKS